MCACSFAAGTGRHPDEARRVAPARPFGCARVVFDDALERVTPAKASTTLLGSPRNRTAEGPTRIVREHRAAYVEDPCVRGLGRTKRAKSVHDAGWSAFVRIPEYKAARYRRALVGANRFLASSRTCSERWAVDGPRPLHVRTRTCSGCGAVHDRDVNASRIVLTAGRKLAGAREAES